ncbi:hypothetical protein TeGR_g11994 [Tetraparma gracilis]|uniref:Phosphatidate cytidylyltransferase n=1 Tax=Tetraparma gracilis TaxID=2962635 RepID=A0ABQ6MB42_9STRA|nr:hypothetical protein TeGR_g11994 [Tetraparma gracilis]
MGLLLRFLTVSVAIPLAVSLLLSPLGGRLLLLSLFSLSIHEYFSLNCFLPPPIPHQHADLLSTLVLACALLESPPLASSLPSLLSPLSLLLTLVLLALRLLPSLPARPLPLLLSALAPLYVALGFHSLLGIHSLSLPHALMFCAYTWLADTGALLAGTYLPTIPAPALLRRVSPGKTGTGYLGAFAVTTLSVALLDGRFLPGDGGGWARPLVKGPLVAGLAVAGDLIESGMKRAAGAKDSGTFFPGHGGALDRMDSMLLSAPVYLWLYVLPGALEELGK